jgi:DNA repair photolyase
MPANVARVVDVRTSHVYDRIEAINDFVDAGYEVHINLSPVIIYNGWQKDYRDLLRQIDDTLSDAAKAQLAAEVIFLTHNERLHELNMQWHPQAERDYLWRHWEDSSDKSYNEFGHTVIQQRKISQNGMVNLRYKNNHKSAGVEDLKQMMEEIMPYCRIRYIF